MNKSKCEIDNEGTKWWYLHDKLHREDGPAIEKSDGTNYWYKNGKRHRLEGPAIEWAKGNKSWWLNDELHREDGLAIESADGTKFWYLHGTELSEDLFNKVTKGPVKDLPMYLGQGFDEFIAKRLSHN